MGYVDVHRCEEGAVAKTKSLQPVEVQVEPVFAIQVHEECGADPGFPSSARW